jgi:hypothetical protein
MIPYKNLDCKNYLTQSFSNPEPPKTFPTMKGMDPFVKGRRSLQAFLENAPENPVIGLEAFFFHQAVFFKKVLSLPG